MDNTVKFVSVLLAKSAKTGAYTIALHPAVYDAFDRAYRRASTIDNRTFELNRGEGRKLVHVVYKIDNADVRRVFNQNWSVSYNRREAARVTVLSTIGSFTDEAVDAETGEYAFITGLLK